MSNFKSFKNNQAETLIYHFPDQQEGGKSNIFRSGCKPGTSPKRNRMSRLIYSEAGGELQQNMAASFGYGLNDPKTLHFFLFYPVTITIRQAMVNKTKLFLLRETRQGSGFDVLPACCSFVDG